MFKKLFVFLSLLIIASMMLAACGGGQPAETEAPAAPEAPAGCKPYKAASVEFQSNIFYDEIYKGLKESVDASGGELLRSVSGGDLQKELAAVENFLSQDIDVLFISMSDPVGSMEAIRKANEAGVPVIAVALGPDPAEEADIVTFIRSNDYKAAAEVAEYILKQIDYKGDVVLADGPQVSVVLERMKAYKDVIAKYPDVHIAGEAMKEEVTIPANATMIENLLTAAPNAVAVFDYAGYGIPAAATVLPNLGREDVWVGEIDGIPEEIELLASGAVKGATAQQQPYLFGTQAVDAWLKYCENPNRTDIPPITEVPTLLITNENAKDFQAPAETEAPAAPEAPAGCKPYKAASVEFQSNIFYDEIYKGLKESVDASGGELLRSVSGGDLQKELAAVENFLSQDIDVLFISMSDPVGSMEAIRKANEAGVPVIAVALGPDPAEEADIVTFIRSNDYKAAAEVAEYILKQIDYKGDVVLADGPQVSVVLERMKAYKDVIAKYPDVHIAGEAMKEEVTIPANATMIENLLTAAPNAVAVFDYAGYGIPAAATVLPNLGREDVWVGEIDGIPEEIELLASGAVKGATAQQQPYLFGTQAVDAWLKYCENPNRTDIPPITEVPTLLITNENAKDFQ